MSMLMDAPSTVSHSPTLLLVVIVTLGLLLLSYRRSSSLSIVPPAHWSAPYSSLWILYQRYKERENRTVYTAHCKFGAVVRLSPQEISVNDYEGGIRTIYGKHFRKHPWFLNIFANYGVQNNFCMQNKKNHANHRRLLAKMYARSAVVASQSFHSAWKRVLWESALPVLETAAQLAHSVDMVQMGAAYGVDFTTSFLYGTEVGSDFLHDRAERSRWFEAYEAMKKSIFWVGELPGLVDICTKLRINLLPPGIEESVSYISDWSLAMCREAREHDKTSETPSSAVFSQLDQILKADKSSYDHLHSDPEMVIASELLDQTTAALDGLAGVLSYAFFELSRPENSHIQQQLRTELRSSPLSSWATKSYTSVHSDLPDPKACDALPLLEAIVYETLRLHPPASGSLPRLTPETGTHILGFDLPANIRISCSPYSLHRNAEIFPDPCSWTPQRWTGASLEQRERMQRWWFAFGSGPRTCLGMHLVLLMVKWMLALTYLRFETRLTDSQDYEADMRPTDGFVGRPSGNRCLILLSIVPE